MPTLWLTADFSSWYISLWKNSQQMSETLSHLLLLLLLLLHNSVQNRAVRQPHNCVQQSVLCLRQRWKLRMRQAGQGLTGSYLDGVKDPRRLINYKRK